MKINKDEFSGYLKEELNSRMMEEREELKRTRKDLTTPEINKMCQLYTKPETAIITEAFQDTILRLLENGHTISMYGFGIFDMAKLPERWCPDPQTGEKCIIKEHWVPRFYPGKRMKVAVKKWEDNKRRGIK